MKTQEDVKRIKELKREAASLAKRIQRLREKQLRTACVSETIRLTAKIDALSWLHSSKLEMIGILDS